MKAKKRLPLIDKLLLWVNYALAAALLVSYLAPSTDPRKIWLIAFFGLAYPPLLLCNFLLIVYWALRQRWYFLLSLICILCGLGVLNNNIGFHPGSDKPITPNSIRMMTYNVHNFKKFGFKKDISTKHEILDLIHQQHPDIIGIQEFYSRKKGQYDIADSIKKFMQSDHCYIQSFQQYSPDEIIGIAIFSKYPIVNQGVIRLSPDYGDGTQCLYIDVIKNNQTIRIYSAHLQSVQFDPKDYRYLDTALGSAHTNLHFITHLGGKLKKAFPKRAEQVFKIKAHAAQCPYPYIISGDFNDTPSSFAVNQMAKGLKNAFAFKGFGLGRTYNGSFPNYQIDYIMASLQFNVNSYQIIEKKLSDHYPVVSDLVLK